MPDSFDASGLKVATLSEIIVSISTAMQAIYGTDINIDQNSPDGQMIGIFSQACEDIRELAVEINNGFDPDQATGSTLDQRVAINNISRRGGTYTIQPIDITVSTTVSLQGLDANFNDPNGTGYTIQDDQGNLFILQNSITLTPGLTTVDFRAQLIGAVETIVDTITTPVTIILGVTSVNNSVGPLSVGQNQETDPQLRQRRQQSVAIASAGYLNGLLAAILQLGGVVDAALYENVGPAMDINGIPGHGIWLVVEGGANTDIANTIYAKKSYGCNMKGLISVNITTASGEIFTALFDTPVAVPLYIEFNIKKYLPTASFDTDLLAQYIVDNLKYRIGETAETSEIVSIARAGLAAQGSQGAAVDLFISDDDSTWTDFILAHTLGSQWTLATDQISITVL